MARRIGRKSRRAPASGRNAPGELSPQLLERIKTDFASNDTYRLMQNAVAQVSVQKLALRQDVLVNATHSYSIKLDDWTTTAQKSSGRCWLFAGLNCLRVGAMKKMKLKNFEFSQNWPMFWDKLEKANYFLEAIIETAAREQGDRTVDFLLRQPVGDGGQWNMFVNIVKKYGLVPKAAMPETESSSSTSAMNRVLVAKLRQAAKQLRDLSASGAGAGDLRAAKRDALNVVHRILRIHLGDPPERFSWQWRDNGGKFHRDEAMSPHAFARKYVTTPLDQYVCLVNDPRPTSPIGRPFTVEYLGNVVGGDRVVYLNVEMDLIKSVTLRMLKAGEPVWFGCDVSKQMEGDAGVWDLHLRDLEGVYRTDFDLDRAARLQYGAAAMNHAMLFTGVDLVGAKPRRWRVENSWGDQKGSKGFFLMNDTWFDEHMFEIAAPKKYVPRKLLGALSGDPIVLPAWDPMGSLA